MHQSGKPGSVSGSLALLERLASGGKGRAKIDAVQLASTLAAFRAWHQQRLAEGGTSKKKNDSWTMDQLQRGLKLCTRLESGAGAGSSSCMPGACCMFFCVAAAGAVFAAVSHPDSHALYDELWLQPLQEVMEKLKLIN